MGMEFCQDKRSTLDDIPSNYAQGYGKINCAPVPKKVLTSSLDPASMYDDAAPVAPRRPEKETHVPKGKKRTDPVFAASSHPPLPPPLPLRTVCFFLHRSHRGRPSLPPSRSCYRYIRRSDRQIPLPPAVAALLPSPSFFPRVSNDSLGGGNEILILRDDDVDV